MCFEYFHVSADWTFISHQSIRRPITVVLYLSGCTCSVEAGITWHCLVMTHRKESLYLQGRSAPRMRVCLSDRIHQNGSIEANRKTLWGLLERARLWLYALRDLHFFLDSNLQFASRKWSKATEAVLDYSITRIPEIQESHQCKSDLFSPKHII